MSDLAPSGQRVRSPETWARAREDYAGGLSAPEVCERYDLGLSAFRARARAEGWRRCDEADPAPADLCDGEDGEDDLAPASPGDMAALAWRRAAQAVRSGRVADAWRWTRLHRELHALADQAAERAAADARAAQPPVVPPHHQELSDSFAAIAAQTLAGVRHLLEDDPAPPRQTPEPAEAHDLHDLHAESGPPADSRPPNRAERRRRARLAAWKARRESRAGPPPGP